MANKHSEDRRARWQQLRRQNRAGIPVWGFLVTALMLLLLFFLYMNFNKGEKIKKPPKLASIKAKSHVLGNTYSNKVHNFRISRPTLDWQFRIQKGKDILPLESNLKDPTLSYLAQMQSIVKLVRYDVGFDEEIILATVEVGIVPLSGPRSAKTVATESYLETFVENEYRETETLTLKKPSAYASGSLKSAYYVITSEAHAPFDTLAVVFVVRDLKAHIMVAKVRQKDYDTYKWDFEQIFNSFNYFIE